MRTKNFFKGLAVAAVALVGVFATSCSEEELKVTATGGNTVTLPAPKATAIITVVDMGDMSVPAQVLATEIKDVTGVGTTSIECPSFANSENYVIPAAQSITVPTLADGESLSIPVTFYVVKLTSAFATITQEEVNEGTDPNYTAIEGLPNWISWVSPYAEITEVSGLTDAKLKNETPYWIDVTYTYIVKEGISGIISPTNGRVAATGPEAVIDAYVNNLLNSNWTGYSEYEDESEPLCIYSSGYATGKLIQLYTKPTYKFTYGETSKEYTFRQEYDTYFVWTGAQAIPGHEHAYDHSHAHGSYENAGGGAGDAF